MELKRTIRIEQNRLNPPEDDAMLAADKEARGWSPQTRSPTTAAATTSTEKQSISFYEKEINYDVDNGHHNDHDDHNDHKDHNDHINDYDNHLNDNLTQAN